MIALASAGGARVEKASVGVLLTRIGSDRHRTRSRFLYYCISKGSPLILQKGGAEIYERSVDHGKRARTPPEAG